MREVPEKLSDAQLRHLAELVAIEQAKGVAYWRPVGGEWRSALSLARRGLVSQDFGNQSGGRAFSLTAAGRVAARDEATDA